MKKSLLVCCVAFAVLASSASVFAAYPTTAKDACYLDDHGQVMDKPSDSYCNYIVTGLDKFVGRWVKISAISNGKELGSYVSCTWGGQAFSLPYENAVRGQSYTFNYSLCNDENCDQSSPLSSYDFTVDENLVAQPDQVVKADFTGKLDEYDSYNCNSMSASGASSGAMSKAPSIIKIVR